MQNLFLSNLSEDEGCEKLSLHLICVYQHLHWHSKADSSPIKPGAVWPQSCLSPRLLITNKSCLLELQFQKSTEHSGSFHHCPLSNSKAEVSSRELPVRVNLGRDAIRCSTKMKEPPLM